MYTLIFVLSFGLISNAFASYTTIKCSNSDGSVKWEVDQNDNRIDLKYSNFVEGILTLDVKQVKINLQDQVPLREKNFKNCHYSGKSLVYAGKVKITPSDLYPDVLRGQFPENSIQTDVICTSISTRLLKCRDEH